MKNNLNPPEKPKRTWSKWKAFKATASIIGVLIGVMMWQLPVETVFAEGEGDVPDFLVTLDDMGMTNITFQLVDAVIGFEMNNDSFTFAVQSATVTIVEVQISPETTQITIYLDIEGVVVDIPEIKLTLNKLFLELKFTIHGNKSVFKVLGKTYVPIYRLIESAITP